jgi:sulfite exporter TauE/SafE
MSNMPHELSLVFAGGLLGSAHCVGMCGGFALSIGAASDRWLANLSRQLVYSLGRIATYTSAGAIAAFAGLRVSHAVSSFVPVQAILALIAGVLLVVQGLSAAGVWRRTVPGTQHPCLLPPLLSTFLRAGGWSGTFLSGVFTGFLPCGLVYAFLALASATQNMIAGWLTMLAFGLGTVPIMVMTGLGGSLLTLAARRRTLRVAGWCVVLAGMLSLVRGVGFLKSAAAAEATRAATDIACPFCNK